MIDLGFWPKLVLAVLATWRITHLLAREDGPGDVLVRVRVRLGSRFFGRLMDCYYCLSLWVAAPLAFVLGRTPLDLVLSWLALSGAACLLERLGQQPVVMQPAAPAMDIPPGTEPSNHGEGEQKNGMLRTEASGSPGGNSSSPTTTQH